MVVILDNIKVNYPTTYEPNQGNSYYPSPNNKLHKTKIFISVFAISIIIAVAVALFSLKIYYDTRLHLNTIINGIDMSNLTAEEVYHSLSASTDNYLLRVIDKDELVTDITKEDIGLTASSEKIDEAISKIFSEQDWRHLFDVKNYEIYDFNAVDREKLLTYIKGSNVFNPRKIIIPQNAYITFDDSLGKFIIVPSSVGNELKHGFADILESNVLKLESTMNLLDMDLYVSPQITENNEVLIHNLKLQNDYLPGDYTLDMDGAIEILSVSQYHDWFIPNYLNEDDSVTVRKINPDDPFTLDTEKLEDYASYLYKKYTTFGSTREFTTNSGRNIRITQGDYGWWLNYRATLNLIQDALLGKDSSEPLQALYYQKAAERGEKDYGNSYVEIDLASQYLWLYDNGKSILSSSVVTGKPSAGNATPPGIYSVTYKQRNATLNGPGYSTPVSYWIPFNKDIGLHDATWQSSFGGNRYLTHGSNGCINLPYDVAKQIFSYVEKEFPVVLY